jgi:hypothetical protein
MEKASKKVATQQQVKAALEAIAGREVSPLVPVQPVNLYFRLGLCVGTFGQQEQIFPQSFYTYRNLLFDNITHQTNARVLDVSGFSTTGSDGKSVFQLSTFAGFNIQAEAPIQVLATPRGGLPFFLTVEHALTQPGPDVEITVHAWNPQGKPAPNVEFDWQCRVLFATLPG